MPFFSFLFHNQNLVSFFPHKFQILFSTFKKTHKNNKDNEQTVQGEALNLIIQNLHLNIVYCNNVKTRTYEKQHDCINHEADTIKTYKIPNMNQRP